MSTSIPVSPAAAPRFASIDAYRGLVMLLMMAEVLRLCAVARAIPDSGVWGFLCHQQSHVEWVGCTLHDLIQPSFSFLVGVALACSVANRRARGQPLSGLMLHAAGRALALALLGIFLRSIGRPQTYFTFEDTLTQIGLGYFVLFLVALGSPRWHWGAVAVVLAGYWAAFALYPAPGPDFGYARAGVSADWLKVHGLSGFAAHWNKNSNLAWAFDTWFLNLFPREKPFEFNGGGYATLSFIPTLGTMLLGLIAGGVLRSERSARARLKWLAGAGVVGLALGVALDRLGLCPVVKRIWTPAWTLHSGGWCFLILAAFHGVTDIGQRRAWAFPLIVIGMNSLAAYCMDWLFAGFIRGALQRHLGGGFFKMFGAPCEPLVLGAGVLFALWLVLFWMYRRKLFLRL